MKNSAPDKSTQFLRSSFYEKLVEHVFISEILQEVWFRHGKSVAVLRSEVDDTGYDVVLECGSIIRHVQLKNSHADSRTSRQTVHVALADKPGGCVVWIVRHEEPVAGRVRLGYRFFGDKAGRPLPPLGGYKVARHTKADSHGVKGARANVRVVPKHRFEDLSGISDLADRLFGASLKK